MSLSVERKKPLQQTAANASREEELQKKKEDKRRAHATGNEARKT